tara:strand:+ start:1325 stop:1888 length:564 start_codon:yes stop_codon:yes gene_type:complete
MKSLYQFIVKPVGGRRYDNIKKIGNTDFIMSTSEEDAAFSNRQAEVIETPLNYNGSISKGDILLVHHNVFKFYNDMYGRRKSGRSFLKDDLFFVDPDQFFAYKKNNKWYGYDRYCFLKPIPPTESYIFKPLTKEPLMGEMVIVNDGLKEKGVKKGDIVTYKPNQEYQFNVDNQILWRMYDHTITLIL